MKITEFLESIALSHGLEPLTLQSTLNAVKSYRACGFERNRAGTHTTFHRVWHISTNDAKKREPKDSH